MSRSTAAIGEHGLALIEAIAARKRRATPVNVLTHCNAGWLADRRLRHRDGADLSRRRSRASPLHVWVDETRPRNQGAALTAFELGQHGVPHTVIADNAGGHLMQHGHGRSRHRRHRPGHRAAAMSRNKIGTYLKALAAQDNGVPFYVALPSPTIDWTLRDGVRDIPIEERAAERGHDHAPGVPPTARIETVRIAPDGSPAANYGFRRDAGAPRHRPHHRARRRAGDAGGLARAVSGQGGVAEARASGPPTPAPSGEMPPLLEGARLAHLGTKLHKLSSPPMPALSMRVGSPRPEQLTA